MVCEMEGWGEGRGRWSVGEVGLGFGFWIGRRIFERGMFSRSESESASISPSSFIEFEGCFGFKFSFVSILASGPSFSFLAPCRSSPLAPLEFDEEKEVHFDDSTFLLLILGPPCGIGYL